MSEDNQQSTAKLIDGAEWADHDGYLLGDEAGLRNLIAACEGALQCGEHAADLGHFIGVKKLDREWFDQPKRPGSSVTQNVMLGIIVLAILGFAMVGLYSTVAGSM
ncbi:MAG: hypothetical protein AAGJ86_04590 [Pseudomonadota bacterium]